MISLFASPRRALRAICLLAPLGVYLLPRFATTFEEDLLLAALAVYWLVLAFDRKRLESISIWRPWLEGALWGVVYSIAWFGLLRGYGEFGTFWAFLFPLSIITAWALDRDEAVARPIPSIQSAQWFLLFAGGALSLFFALVWMIGDHGLRPALNPSPFQAVAVLALFPLLALSLSVWPMAGHAQAVRVFTLLAALLFATTSVWAPNLSLAKLWWEAGRYERAWTPFRYDEPQQIAEAEQAPRNAMTRYLSVVKRLGDKGRLPRLWNWEETMYVRAAEQGRRTLDARLLLAPIAASGDLRERLIEQTIDCAFYDRLRDSAPDIDRESLFLWVDIEIDPQTGVEYRMDRWGRIYTNENGMPRLIWRPERLRDDAIDLELFEGDFVILYRDGTIVCSRPTDWLERPPAPLYLGGFYVDMEFLHHTRGALMVSSRGEIASLGDPPQPFPLWNEMAFDQDVLVDMEIDEDDRGYYLLDHFGAIHANHLDGSPSMPYRSPAVAAELLPYWSEQPTARDLVIDPLRRGISIYNRLGEVYTIATAPYRETVRPLRERSYRGVALTAAPDGSLRALEANGAVRHIPVGVTAPQ